MPNAMIFFPDNQFRIHNKFCSEPEARKFLERVEKKQGVGSAIISDSNALDLVYGASSKLRAIADRTKAQLSKQARIKAALDRQGVPMDQGLRAKISGALLDMGI